MSSNTPRAPPGAPPSFRSPVPPSGIPPSQRNKVKPPPGKPKNSKPKPPPGGPPSGRSRPQNSSRNGPSNRNKSSRRKRKDSSDSDTSSSSDTERENNQDFRENKKRLDVKKKHKAKREDIPTKYNDYLGRRLSNVLRGEDEDLPDLHDFLYEDDLEDEFVSDNWCARVIYNFRKKSTEKKFLPRAMLCALAVTLLWCSSAAACRLLITAIIPTPTYSEIEGEVVTLQDRVDIEKAGYTNCVLDETANCRLDFDTTSNEEAARLITVQEANQAILDSEGVNLENCLADFTQAVEEVNLLLADTDILNIFARDQDDVPEGINCNDLSESVVGSEIDALAAVNVAAQSGEASEAVVQNYEDQLKAREEYDRRYIENITRIYQERAGQLQDDLFGSEDIGQSLAEQQGELRACLSDTRDFINDEGRRFVCDENQSVAFQASQFVGSLESQYADMEAQMEEYINQVEDLQRIVNQVSSLGGTLDLIGVDISGLPDLDADPLDFAMQVGLEQLEINQEIIDEYVAAREQELLDALEESAAGLDELDAEMERRQQEFLAELNDEYILPGTDPDVAAQAAGSKSQAAGLGSGVAGDLASANNQVPETEEPVNFTLILQETEVNFLNGLEDRSVDLFAYQPDVFLNLESNLNRFIELILLFDILWRVLQSILLIKKYWNISAVATPPADVRSQKGRLFKERKNIFQKVGAFLTNPIMQMVYNLIVIGGLSILFYIAYEPVFNEFVSGCINSNSFDIRNGDATGTMIFRNLDTMTVGIAASEGDQLITTEVDTLNVERQLSCSDLLQDSVTVRQSHIDAHDDLRKNYNAMQLTYKLFNGCVDWEAVDTDAGNVLDTTFLFDPIFSTAQCNREVLEVDVGDNALHNCSNVAPCDITGVCTGPNLVSLALANHNAACEVEYALHSFFLVGLFATLMFICLNLARFFFLRGIVEVGWPTICLDVYSYLISCTERGTIIPPEDVEEGEAFQDVIKEALDKALRAFTIKGYLDLTFAISINLPWIIFISVFGANIQFQAN